MIVCFDLRALQIGHQNRGIGMYVKSVLEHLPPSNHRYIFYAFDSGDPVRDLNIKLAVDYELVQTPTIKTVLDSPKDIGGLLRLLNHDFGALKTSWPDIFIQFDFTLGAPQWPNTRVAVVAYDLIPLIMRNHYLPSISFAYRHAHPGVQRRSLKTITKEILRLRFRPRRPVVAKARLRAVLRAAYYRFKFNRHYRLFRRADHLISISQATTDDFIRLLKIRPEKIATIPLAPVLPSDQQAVRPGKSVRKPYIFYIGGTDYRKKVEDVVRAFNVARGRGADISLVLAGNEFREVDQIPDVAARAAIQNSPYKDDIQLLGFVSDQAKIGLYQEAHAFVFCTVYEGFGLPVIEAMSMGCPVISYNNSSIPEAAGSAAQLVATGDYVAVAEEIIALYDQKLRRQLISAGRRQAQKFNWQNYIAELEKVIAG